MTDVFAGKKDKIHYTRLAPYREAFGGGIPVLCYHKVGPRPAGVRLPSLYIPTSLLARQFDELAGAGFGAVSLDRWRDFSDGNPGKRVVLTFDDGSETAFRHALPLLQKHGFRAIQYLVSSQIGGANAWDTAHGEVLDRLMDESQIREWLAAGHEIGAHTVTHPHLPKLDPASAKEEITGSKKRLEDLFGIPIRHFCYPYGDWKKWVRDLVGEAGYETAVTLDPGINATGLDPLAIKRIGARYATRNFRNVLAGLLEPLGLGALVAKR